MRIPSPGEFIPDSPSSAGGGLVGIVVFLIVLAMLADSCGKSGAGAAGRLNYLKERAVCVPSVPTFDELIKGAAAAFDAGMPTTAETELALATSAGAIILPASTEVQVQHSDSKGHVFVTPKPTGTLAGCWVYSRVLRMGWGEWLSWKWGLFQAGREASRVTANLTDRITRRIALAPPKIVACQTGTTVLKYNGTSIEEAWPVDFSRCLARQGQVHFSGPVGGLVYFTDGTSSSSFERVASVVLFAGPAGSNASLSCVCSR